MEQYKKREMTPVRDRWLVKMFSPPSINKVGHAMDPNFYDLKELYEPASNS